MLQPEIFWVRGIAPARLALMPRPRGGEWLEDEIAGWKRASIDTVVSLLESHEIRDLELQGEERLCQAAGIDFLTFPIADRGVPRSEGKLADLALGLHRHIEQGRSVAIHCRVGVGRTGLVAGCLLHLIGVPSEDIFHLLSRSRGLAMPDTAAQADWVERFCRCHARSDRIRRV
jgi:protein-tyrosine phosphatase